MWETHQIKSMHELIWQMGHLDASIGLRENDMIVREVQAGFGHPIFSLLLFSLLRSCSF